MYLYEETRVFACLSTMAKENYFSFLQRKYSLKSEIQKGLSW